MPIAITELFKIDKSIRLNEFIYIKENICENIKILEMNNINKIKVKKYIGCDTYVLGTFKNE